jgi:hypothetical protein
LPFECDLQRYSVVGMAGGGRKKAPLPLDLTKLPGVELLSKVGGLPS